MVKCAYHPDRAALSTCAECSAPMCRECETMVKGKPVCARCVQAIRAKVAAEIGAAAPQAGSPPAGYPAAPTPPSVYPGNPATSAHPGAQGTVYAPPAPMVREDPNPLGLLAGIGLGALFGVIGAFVRAKFVLYTNIQFGLVDSLVGFFVGYGVVLGSKRGGMAPALIGAVLAFLAMMLGWYFLTGDMLAKIAAQRGVPAPPMSFALFMKVVQHLDAMDWVFVAIGVYGGFRMPMRAGERQG